MLRLFDGDVDAAAAALRAETSYRGALRGGVGDPKPSESDPDGRPMLSEDDWVRGANGGIRGGGGGGGDDARTDEDASDDDWEPVVTKRRGGGGRRGGGVRRDDDLDERIGALRI